MQIDDLIPKTGFFPEYLRYVRNLTDAPEIYHVASALAVVSAAVCKHVLGWFPSNENSVITFPTNLWVLIVGPSGDRKSTAMNYAVEIGQPSFQDRVSAISGSPEATWDTIVRMTDAFFFHPEGSTLFSQLQATYWAQGQGMLCDLYDGRDDPPYVRTLTGKRTKKNPVPQTYKIEIRSPRITMLVGIAPDMLDSTRKSDWSAGLIGRMLLVYGERTRYNETPAKQDPVGRSRLTELLLQLHYSVQAAGQGRTPPCLRVSIDDDALKAYIAWAKILDADTTDRPSRIKPLLNRLPLHVMRVAALYAVSQYYDVITLDSMIPALLVGDLSRASIERVGDLLAEDLVMRNAIRIRDMLARSPGGIVSVSQLCDALRMSWNVIEPAVRTLQASGRAKLRVDENNPDAKWIELVG